MARHEVVIHENTGATKTVAPYLGSYISKETLAMAKFASALLAGEYTLKVYTRSGLGDAFGVHVASRKVVVG